jgi:methyltransferase (TIGR00027 family)
MENQCSVTALISAFTRAYHSSHDAPKIFDDVLARRLLTEEELAMMERNVAEALELFDPERAATRPEPATALSLSMRALGASVTLSRARFAEDLLEADLLRIRQYVILGAGLDTFALRRPELLESLRVFELDHPATQASKRERLARLGCEQPASLHLVPIDFTKESPIAALERSAYDPRALSFWSWLGVTYYLPREAVLATLRAVAGGAPSGSTVVFDYVDADAFTPGKVAVRMQRMQEAVRRAGEPMKTGFDPEGLGAELARLGLRLLEDLSPSEIDARYFRGRADGYRAFEHIHFARVEVV